MTVWDGSLLLAFILCHRPALVRGKRVLELGAGTGLLGIVCARLGAVSPLSISPSLSHLSRSRPPFRSLPCSTLLTDLSADSGQELVVMTDLTSDGGLGACPVATRFADAIQRNCPGRPACFAPLAWGAAGAARVLRQELQGRPPDVVLCADLVYDPGAAAPLLETLATCGARPPAQLPLQPRPLARHGPCADALVTRRAGSWARRRARSSCRARTSLRPPSASLRSLRGCSKSKGSKRSWERTLALWKRRAPAPDRQRAAAAD